MSIRAQHGEVIWTMDPETARYLAEFIRDTNPASDAAQKDADDLEAAADEADPPAVVGADFI